MLFQLTNQPTTNVPAMPLLVFSLSCFYALLLLTASVFNLPKLLVFLSCSHLINYLSSYPTGALVLYCHCHCHCLATINNANTNNIATTSLPLTMPMQCQQQCPYIYIYTYTYTYSLHPTLYILGMQPQILATNKLKLTLLGHSNPAPYSSKGIIYTGTSYLLPQ
jgi:hypothetical protein